MKKLGVLDVKYSLTQIFYFAAYCGLMGYASVYLLDKGVSNTLIGTTLALVSIIAVFTQPTIASFADKKEVKLQNLIIAILIIAILLSVGIYFLKLPTMALLCVFVGIVTCMMTIQPLLNSLAFAFEKYGIEVNFGLARGLGSVAYALASFALGYMVEAFDANVIPLVYIIFNIILTIVVYSYVIPKSQRVHLEIKEETHKDTEEKVTFSHFCKTYKKFMIFVVSVVLVFFTHTIINNFFIQIITPIDGTESDMGIAVFLAAILELPAMAMFNVVRKKVKCSTLLKISVVFFALKHILTLLAPNMTLIYVAQVLQMGAFAIFTPASVYYVTEIISKKDLVKGQSMITVGITASGIIANLAGGVLLDTVGVHTVLLIGGVVSVLGGILAFMTIQETQ